MNKLGLLFTRKKDKTIAAQEKWITELRYKLNDYEFENIRLRYTIRDLMDRDLNKWNILIHQKNELYRQLQAEKAAKKKAVSLIPGDRPGRVYLQMDNVRHVFQDGEYQGWYDPNGPEDC